MSSCAAEKGIWDMVWYNCIYVGSWGAKSILDPRDCVPDAPTIVIAIYIWFRFIRRDVQSLPQPRLRPWIVDGKLHVQRPN